MHATNSIIVYLLQAGSSMDAEAKVEVARNQQSAAGGGDVPEKPDDVENTGDNKESEDRVEPPPKR